MSLLSETSFESATSFESTLVCALLKSRVEATRFPRLGLKAEISAKDGTKEKTDWSRLLTIIGKSGYRGYAGLEYEGTNEAEIPRLAAELRVAVRKLSA